MCWGAIRYERWWWWIVPWWISDNSINGYLTILQGVGGCGPYFHPPPVSEPTDSPQTYIVITFCASPYHRPGQALEREGIILHHADVMKTKDVVRFLSTLKLHTIVHNTWYLWCMWQNQVQWFVTSCTDGSLFWGWASLLSLMQWSRKPTFSLLAWP